MKSKTKMRKNNSFRKIWLRLSALSVVATSVPILVLGIFYYSSWTNKETENFTFATTSYLQDISRTMRQNIFMIGNDIQLLLNNENFVNYKRMTKPGEHVAEVKSINNHLAELCSKYPFVTSAYFYHPVSDSLVTNYYGTYSATGFYDTEWIERIPPLYIIRTLDIRTNANQEYIENAQKARLLVYRPELVITMVGTGFNSSTVAINISAEGLHSWVEKIYPMKNCEFYLVNNEAEIVSAKVSSEIGSTLGTDILQQKMEVLLQEGSVYFINAINENLYGVIVYPEAGISPYSQQFRYFIILLVVLLAGVLSLFSAFMTRKIYSPVNELAESIQTLSKYKVGDGHQIEDEIETIIHLYHDLESRRDKAATTLSTYQQSLTTYQFRDYIEGHSTFEEWHSAMGEEASLLKGLRYQFVVYHTPKSESLYKTSGNSADVINRYLSESASGLFLELERGIYCTLILENAEPSLETMENIVTRLLEEMLEAPLYLGYSPKFSDPVQMADMYQLAKQISQLAYFFDIRATRETKFCTVEESAEEHDFLINYETRIIKNILCGEKEKIPVVLEELGQKVRGVCSTSNFARSVYLRLITTVSQELETGVNLELTNQIYKLDTLGEIQMNVADYMERLARRFKEGSENVSVYSEQAKKILEENYHKDLSVLEVAEEIGISYPYLSKLFKDDTGVSLLEYLHQVRIEASKDMLSNTNENISSIGEQVGYNNPQSFQRYFKRIVGVTPGSYRKMQQQKE